MIKQVIVVVFMLVGLSSVAQQGLQMDFGEIDSTEIQLHRQLEYHQLINGTFNESFLVQDFKLPKFELIESKHTTYNVGIGAFPQARYIGAYSGMFAGASPFMHNTEILSEAAYSLGKKLVVGGFSYVANTMMMAPIPNQPGSYFDTYGSTMFMKYKVSKSVSIETSISVGQSRGPGF
jgi:hypothetical protein